MLADKVITDHEKHTLLEFFKSKFWNTLSATARQVAYHKDKLDEANFLNDAKIAYLNFSREDLFDILDFIAKMIKSDWKVDMEESYLFEVLLWEWKIEKDIMISLWVKKSLWSKFFA